MKPNSASLEAVNLEPKPMQTSFLIAFCLTLLPTLLSGQTTLVGSTQPIREIQMSFPEAGVIAQIPVQEGQTVTEGQLLSKLDTQVLEATLRIAKIKAESRSSIQSAQANWNLRRRRLDELERLAKTGSANRDEVGRALTEFEVADAELAAAKEEVATLAIQVEQIAAQIERHTLRSPFDGVVTRIFPETGENVQPGRGPVVTVVKLDQLRLVLHVEHQAVQQLQPGQTVPVRRLDGNQDPIQARVEFVSPVTDAASGTTRIKLILDNVDGEHRSGAKYSVDLNDLQPGLAQVHP